MRLHSCTRLHASARAALSLALLAGLAHCDAHFEEQAPLSAPIFFDAGTASPLPVGREVLSYDVVDIPSWADECDRLPVPAGLLAPIDRSQLTCTDHSGCPTHSLCSARIGCSTFESCDLSVLSTWCTSDRCQNDAHCQTGFRCRCEGAQKECVEASCERDGDCGAGQVCRLTWVVRKSADESLTCNGDVKHYACTTAMDECSDDKSCPPYNARCGYDHTRNRFACLTCGWRVP